MQSVGDSFSGRPAQQITSRGAGRSAPIWLLWLAFAALAAAAALFHFLSTTYAALLAIYPLQSLVAERLGVRIDSDGVVAPRRIFNSLPLLTLWRERIPVPEISYLLSLRPSWAGERVILVTHAQQAKLLLFRSRAERLSFFERVTRASPSVDVYRAE